MNNIEWQFFGNANTMNIMIIAVMKFQRWIVCLSKDIVFQVHVHF